MFFEIVYPIFPLFHRPTYIRKVGSLSGGAMPPPKMMMPLDHFLGTVLISNCRYREATMLQIRICFQSPWRSAPSRLLEYGMKQFLILLGTFKNCLRRLRNPSTTQQSVTGPTAMTPDKRTLLTHYDHVLCLPSQPFSMAKFAKCSYSLEITTRALLWMAYTMNQTGPKTLALLRLKRGDAW